jgi:hypothetical protein
MLSFIAKRISLFKDKAALPSSCYWSFLVNIFFKKRYPNPGTHTEVEGSVQWTSLYQFF